MPFLKSPDRGEEKHLCFGKSAKFSGCQETVGSCVFSSVWHSALFPSALWPGWPHRRLFLSQRCLRLRAPLGRHHPKTLAFKNSHRCSQWLHMLVSGGWDMTWKSKPIEICQRVKNSNNFSFAFVQYATNWNNDYFFILLNWSTSYTVLICRHVQNCDAPIIITELIQSITLFQVFISTFLDLLNANYNK